MFHLYQNPANPKYFELYHPEGSWVTRSHPIHILFSRYPRYLEPQILPSSYFEGWSLVATTSDPSTLPQTHPELFI